MMTLDSVRITDNGHAHAQAVEERGGDGHGGAHAQHLHQNGVVGDQRPSLNCFFKFISHVAPPSQPMTPATARAALTPVVTPLVDTVAPVMASTLLPTVRVPSAALLPIN